MMTCNRPSYALGDIKEMAANGRLRPTKKAERFLLSHYDADPCETIATVVSQLTEEDFAGSFELADRPGTMADVYVGGCHFDTEWYVKAIIEDEAVSLQVWTMLWEGTTF